MMDDKVAPPAQNPFVWTCAVCIHLKCSPIKQAMTMVNGSAVCEQHCYNAPRSALPIEVS